MQKYTGKQVYSTCVLVYLFTFSLSAKISGILAPQIRIPFQDCVIIQFVFCEPILRTADHDEKGRVSRGMFELCSALTGIHPRYSIFRIGINRQLLFHVLPAMSSA